MSALTLEVLSLICLVWYIFIILVCIIGTFQLFLHYTSLPIPSVSAHSLDVQDVPHVTIIRPCKGVEPYLFECLASTLKQDYPKEKLTVYLCLSSRNDPAINVLKEVCKKFGQTGSGYDVHILIEEEDPVLQGQETASVEHGNVDVLGPNPKIRNMSQAYREAKGDIVWIIDCNVWVNKGACGRMVDKLCGFTRRHNGKLTMERPHKFVHHLPIAVDVDGDDERNVYESAEKNAELSISLDQPSTVPLPALLTTSKHQESFGCRLEEMFLSSSHAKMYTAINVVAVAPCIVGKSNMFRRSHLNILTNKDSSPETRVGSGIDYFSSNICEDHLIGDLLWKSHLPDHNSTTADSNTKLLKWRNHGLVSGDLAIQPIARMSLANYVARRVRWLRVRKFTVPLATLVEPGTESFVCSAMGVWGLVNSSYTRQWFGRDDSVSLHNFTIWFQMLAMWLISISLWAMWDRQVRKLLFSGKTIEESSSTQSSQVDIPSFVLSRHTPFFKWLKSWIGREALALPVWTWAIWGGVSVTWREKRFWVGLDMKVHAYDNDHRIKEHQLGAKIEHAKAAVTGNGHAISNADVKGAKRRKKA